MRLLAILLSTFVISAVPAADPGVEFFEKKVRPVLTENCLKCHSTEAAKAKKLKGGLFLDSRDGVLNGGESGPAVVPGKPAESLLLKSLKYEGDIRMPPHGKLPDAVVADFQQWIKIGAPDPRGASGTRKAVGMSLEEGRKFWAYRPVASPAIPSVKTREWATSEIDFFILAALEAKDLKPSADASREVLARRVYFDLVGLPPTPAEVDAFVADKSPKAFEKLVDRLLQSPQFGERWGRHWLDVARFGESLTLRGFILKEAWRYRDYVIDVFNNDLPFDRFIREQIAGDLLPASSLDERRRQMIATTFLALGNNNLEEQDKAQLRMDVVDEQLDAISKGFLAQTVTCARCHDHKFDPIPTKDYYALAGILRNAKTMEHANVSKWIEVPLPGDPAEEAKYKKHDEAIAVLQAKIKSEKGKAGPRTVAKILPVKEVPGIVVDDAHAKKVGEWQHSVHSGHYIGDGYVHDQNAGKGEKTLTFQPDLVDAGKYEVRLAYSPGTSRAEAVPVHVFSADGEKTIQVDMRKEPSIHGRFISLGEYRVEKNGQAYVIIETEGTKGHVTADAIVFIPMDMPLPKPKADPKVKPSDDVVKNLEAELKRLQESAPKRPMVMTVVDEAKIEDAKVHVRGNVHNLGALAPRGFLQVASANTPISIPPKQSGRKELADWIASKDNPLTARVIVNRTWHWLFGSGIVRTTDNFGTTGELPSHPELLNHLATSFVAERWSMKQLIRTIVLSRTYRQAAALTDERDPENRLLSRANRRRLDAECIRDAMLAVSGRLSPDRGGATFPTTLAADYGFKSADNRRSIYLPVFRNALPEALEAFDFADSSMVMGRRNTSIVAPQALFMLNHPFPAEQAKHAASRLLAEGHDDEDKRITAAYRLTLGREPTRGERDLASRFLGKFANASEAWTSMFHALFASADFRYVD
jgi:cytochrome c553